MPCINPDGTLSVAAKQVLAALENPVTLETAAACSGLPLYQIRGRVRELIEAGLVAVQGERYVITAAGRRRLAEQR
ncbi:MAG: hypothetical protein RMK79_06880 [Anaerolineae bacterium]|nr:hypothetical protein [Anaerolineae bacterium]